MKRSTENRIDQHDLNMVAFNSSPSVRNHNAVVGIDTAMQANYATMKSSLTPRLDPVIVVNNDKFGGTYTLIHNGVREDARPVSRIFELAKSVSHAPLGIYVLIAPYIKQPDALGWVPGLRAFRSDIQTALDSVTHTDLPAEAKAASVRILHGALLFIETSIRRGRFSIESFDDYTSSIHDDIAINMRVAGKAQVDGVESLLDRWKNRLGERSWKDLYVVVLSMWTTMVDNQNTIIIRHFMNPSTVDRRLIDISTAEMPNDPVHVALDNLARIVMDNVAAEMIFPTDPILADSLKGTQDLLSNVISEIMSCPHATVSSRINA